MKNENWEAHKRYHLWPYRTDGLLGVDDMRSGS
jgi:hypothetical protein